MSDTLELNERHPVTSDAARFVAIRAFDPLVLEALASCALANVRTAEIVLGTLERIRNKQPVGERYVLGAAWFLRNAEARP